MKATDVMKEEHRVIKLVLQCLSRVTAQVEKGGTLDRDSAGKMIEFFREFADRCHHGKEEAQFFPLARQRGVGCAPGNIDVLLAEHEEGRSHIRAMDESLAVAEKGDSQAQNRFCQHARQYVGLLTEHIRKEDDCLFPTADMLLTEEDQRALVSAFAQVEHEEMGEGVHERLHALADELCGKWQVPIPSASSHPGCCGHKQAQKN